MTGPHANYLSLRHFKGLDGLRCIAVIMVIWHHSPPVENWTIASRGFVGVDLFFILSGYLICTLLIREKRKTGKIGLKNFWIRRTLRLMPAFYLMLTALLAAYLLFKPTDPNTLKLLHSFPIYALYLSNWFDPGVANLGITWSLATEEQFYLVWPLLEAYLTPIAVAVLWFVFFVINQMINFGLLDGAITSLTGDSDPRGIEILQATFTPILLGVALAHALDHKNTFLMIWRFASSTFAQSALALIAIGILSIPASDISGGIRLAFHLACTLFLATIILAPNGLFTQILNSKPLSFIGMISYGMYLYHMFALHVARSVVSDLGLPPVPAVFVLGATLTIVVSAISYFLFEKWFLNWKDRYRTTQQVLDSP